MKLYRIFLLAVGVVGSLSGCFSGLYCPDAKTDLIKLSTATRQWFTYAPGQIITFQDEVGNLDTIAVAQFSDTSENYWQGDECPERPQEVIRIKLVNRATADTIVISGEFSNQLRIATPTLLTYFTDTNRLFPDNQPSTYSYSERLMVGTQQFSEVLKASCLQCNPNTINELYMAKNRGLVAYGRDGKLWIIKK